MQTIKIFENKLIGLQNNMLNYAFILTSNREAARDLRQETNLRILVNRDKYKDNRNFKGWVYKIMYNIFVNNYHQVARQRIVLDQTDSLYHLNLSQDSGPETPENVYNYIEITNIINSFEDKEKIPLQMYISGFKYKEIAKIMELPIGTIKSRMFFVRRKIQKNMDS